MKKLAFALLIFATLFIACEKDDKSTTPIIEPTPIEDSLAYEFKDQDLQGKIGGQNWVMNHGTFRNYEPMDYPYMFYFSNLPDTNQCDNNYNVTVFVQFALNELKPGIYYSTQCYLGAVMARDTEEDFTRRLPKGAIEILTIDANNNIVTGRIDVRKNETNFVNGNFSITYCKW